MSHLGDLLSALVDGELSGAELDRANAHVAACGACRVEANALRRLKHELRSVAEAVDSADITSRLLAMTSQAAADDFRIPLRRLEREPGRRRRARGAGRVPLTAAYLATSPRRLPGRRRRRYLLWGTVSLVVVGIGSAAFGMGGGSSGPAPRITPQLEVFDAQHAMVSGDLPFADPTADPTADPSAKPTGEPARVPVGAATP